MPGTRFQITEGQELNLFGGLGEFGVQSDDMQVWVETNGETHLLDEGEGPSNYKVETTADGVVQNIIYPADRSWFLEPGSMLTVIVAVDFEEAKLAKAAEETRRDPREPAGITMQQMVEESLNAPSRQIVGMTIIHGGSLVVATTTGLYRLEGDADGVRLVNMNVEWVD